MYSRLFYARPYIVYIFIIMTMAYFANLSMQEITAIKEDGKSRIAYERQRMLKQKRILKKKKRELQLIKEKIERYRIQPQDIKNVELFIAQKLAETGMVMPVKFTTKKSKVYFNAMLFIVKVKSMSKFFDLNEFEPILTQFFKQHFKKVFGVKYKNRKVGDYYILWAKTPKNDKG